MTNFSSDPPFGPYSHTQLHIPKGQISMTQICLFITQLLWGSIDN